MWPYLGLLCRAAAVNQPGPEGGHELRRDQGVQVQEREDLVQDVPQVPGGQLVHDVLTVVDELDHLVQTLFFSHNNCQSSFSVFF